MGIELLKSMIDEFIHRTEERMKAVDAPPESRKPLSVLKIPLAQAKALCGVRSEMFPLAATIDPNTPHELERHKFLDCVRIELVDNQFEKFWFE